MKELVSLLETLVEKHTTSTEEIKQIKKGLDEVKEMLNCQQEQQINIAVNKIAESEKMDIKQLLLLTQKTIVLYFIGIK
jgi:uncharacterized membrane protein (DUF106 family)